ncbi:hypothetical protein EYC84_006359 [Monilinia fructicola]|uniref:Uncharacterized protein n=1 Tax=Monilinia fructicola TaxID=38448 RepID=A0A5M9K7L7_MONFR|nr:hypothetical protein EYC84_006359 [Monilinia fructicola]
MSTITTTTPTSLIQHRDIRSEAQAFKRDKDHSQKWIMGARPLAGVNRAIACSTDGSKEESAKGKEKVRPQKLWSQVANTDRHLLDAYIEAADHASHPLSQSLLDLLPTHSNNTSPSIATAIMNAGDEGVLYSFDRRDTPDNRVDLGGLVDLAEQKWANEQTEKIIRGEYEVLDAEGETILQRQRGRKSPRSKALSRTRAETKTKAEEGSDLFIDHRYLSISTFVTVFAYSISVILHWPQAFGVTFLLHVTFSIWRARMHRIPTGSLLWRIGRIACCLGGSFFMRGLGAWNYSMMDEWDEVVHIMVCERGFNE